MKKCSKKSWCSAMDKFALSQYESGKRIFVTETMNMKSGRTGHAAAYQFGSKRNEWIWLNFCPWCGAIAQFPASSKKENV